MTGRRAFNRLAVAAAGVAAAPAFVRAQPAKLKVGVLLPRSGALAQLGQSCQRGIDIAPAILRDLYGVDLELMSVDFQSSAEQARVLAAKLIGDGAHLLVGPFDSAAAAAIAQVAEQRRVPFVVNIAAAPQITQQGHRFTFRNFPTSVELMRNGLALLRDLFMATRTAPRTCVLMYVDDAFGQANRRAIEAVFPSLDYLPFRIVDSIGYDPAARSLSAEVRRARATGADIVMPVCRLNDAVLLVREMVRQRWSPQGLLSPGSPGMFEEQFYRTLGKYSEYCVSNIPWYDPNARLTAVVGKAFAHRFPNQQLMFNALTVGFSFEAMMVAAEAFRRARSSDGPTLAAALRQTNIGERVMIGGPIRFDAQGHNPGIGSACIQNRNLRPTVVLPSSAAELAPVFPAPHLLARA